jgi:hypothetical protein
MAKGRFVNQKLGKRVSRKFDLLKSELASRSSRKSSSALELRLPKKGTSRERIFYPVYPRDQAGH